MSINAGYLGQLLIVLWLPFTIFITWASLKLATKKTTSPRIAAVVGFLFAFIPPLALLYIAVLVMIKDNPALEQTS